MDNSKLYRRTKNVQCCMMYIIKFIFKFLLDVAFFVWKKLLCTNSILTFVAWLQSQLNNVIWTLDLSGWNWCNLCEFYSGCTVGASSQCSLTFLQQVTWHCQGIRPKPSHWHCMCRHGPSTGTACIAQNILHEIKKVISRRKNVLFISLSEKSCGV